MRLRLLHLLAALTALAAGTSGVWGAGKPGSPEYSGRQPEVVDSVKADFVIDRADLESGPHMERLLDSARRLNEEKRLLKVFITGSASPDGPRLRNEELARQRGEAAKERMISCAQVPDSIILLRSMGENWTQFLGMCHRRLSPASFAEVERICAEARDTEQCKRRLRAARGGRLWEELRRDVLPHLRYAIIMFDALPRMDEGLTATPFRDLATKAVISPEYRKEFRRLPTTVTEPYEPHMYLKSNLPAWFCSWLNAAVEFDLGPHWTAMLPVYYSGFDYFRNDLKFRTFAVVPEVRWFPNRHNRGFFLGAHAGCAWYNVALRGDFRYQDHDGETPALGGGIALGYRLRFGRTKRWFTEFSVGAGVYRLDYDKFLNYHNGLLVGRERRTFIGIDQAAVSFGYTFDLQRKKGGGR